MKDVNGTGGAKWIKGMSGKNSRKATAEAADMDRDPRKRGGAVGKHVEMDAEKKPMSHLGRPGRKRGGRVGADTSPLSGAAKISG